MAVLKDKKKLHGIEVEHSHNGWRVLRKYNRDYSEVLAVCPNDTVAEEIAEALRGPSKAQAELSRLNEIIARLTAEVHALQEAVNAEEARANENKARAEKAEAERDTIAADAIEAAASEEFARVLAGEYFDRAMGKDQAYFTSFNAERGINTREEYVFEFWPSHVGAETSIASAIRALTPADALAAREARDRAKVAEGMREAAEYLTEKYEICDILVGDVVVHGSALGSPASCRDAILARTAEVEAGK